MALTESVRSFPGACHPGHQSLPAELAFGADLAADARHFRGEGPELVDHGVDRFLELQDFAAHVNGELLGKIAIRNGDRESAILRTCAVRFEAALNSEIGMGRPVHSLS